MSPDRITHSEAEPDSTTYFFINLDEEEEFDPGWFDRKSFGVDARLEYIDGKPVKISHLKYIVAGNKMFFFSFDLLHRGFASNQYVWSEGRVRSAGEVKIITEKTQDGLRTKERIIFGYSTSLENDVMDLFEQSRNFKELEFAPRYGKYFLVRGITEND